MLTAFHKISKLIITFSAVIGGWTSIILLSNTTFNIEIKDVIYKMYLNQKEFIFNVKDLSILLLKDANHRSSVNQKDNIKLNDMKNDF